MHNRRPWQPPVYKPQEAPSALLMTPSQSEPSCNVHSHDTSPHSGSRKPWMLSGAAASFCRHRSFSLCSRPCACCLLAPCWEEQSSVESAYGSQSEAECTHHKYVCQANEMCGEWELMMHHACTWCITTHDASWIPMMHHASSSMSNHGIQLQKHGFP